MSIGISDEHVELAASLRKWAASLDGVAATRAADTDPEATFADAWKAIGEMGVATIGLPEAAGDGGGSVLDAAVALEACAHELVPGPLLGTVVAASLLGETDGPDGVAAAIGEGASVALSLDPTLEVVWDAPGASHLLVSDADGAWSVVPAAGASVTATLGLDLSRRFGSVVLAPDAEGVVPVPGLTTELVRRAAVTFAAAEAAGIARWCLRTAVDYAKVREQFGKPIGSFQ
ncbi:MAG: acyl-CoA dehydrogenase family protein, partial [Nocardioides sp.]|nr:acyl-CoA dehydrogenase family protein [Nocardioides sp.]